MSTPAVEMHFKTSGVHAVNAFLWSRLEKDLGWSKKNYGGTTPILTPQQSQQFNDSGFPYITYTYRTSNGANIYIQEESIAYVIHSSKEENIRQAMRLMQFYFTSLDDSATVVNQFLSTDPSVYPGFKEFDFKAISAPAITGASPTDQEGGIQDATASLFITYTRENTLRVN